MLKHTRQRLLAPLLCLSLVLGACSATPPVSPGWVINQPGFMPLRQVSFDGQITWLEFDFYVPEVMEISDQTGKKLSWARSGYFIGVAGQPEHLRVGLGSWQVELVRDGRSEVFPDFIETSDYRNIVSALAMMPQIKASPILKVEPPVTANWSPARLGESEDAPVSETAESHLPADESIFLFEAGSVDPSNADVVSTGLLALARQQSGSFMVRAEVVSGADKPMRLLAARRAIAVAQLLVQRGIASERIVVTSVRERLQSAGSTAAVKVAFRKLPLDAH